MGTLLDRATKAVEKLTGQLFWYEWFDGAVFSVEGDKCITVWVLEENEDIKKIIPKTIDGFSTKIVKIDKAVILVFLKK